jgi:hypothetical protein
MVPVTGTTRKPSKKRRGARSFVCRYPFDQRRVRSFFLLSLFFPVCCPFYNCARPSFSFCLHLVTAALFHSYLFCEFNNLPNPEGAFSPWTRSTVWHPITVFLQSNFTVISSLTPDHSSLRNTLVSGFHQHIYTHPSVSRTSVNVFLLTALPRYTRWSLTSHRTATRQTLFYSVIIRTQHVCLIERSTNIYPLDYISYHVGSPDLSAPSDRLCNISLASLGVLACLSSTPPLLQSILSLLLYKTRP